MPFVKNRKILLGIFLLVLIGFAFHVFLDKQLPVEQGALCALKENSRLGFHLQAKMNMLLSAAGLLGQSSSTASQNINTELEADLYLFAVKIKGAATTVQAHMSNVAYKINGKKDPHKTASLSQPIQFDLTNTCQATNFRFSKKISKNDANILQNILQEMQITLPESSKTKNWNTEEKNTLGTYQANYHVAAIDGNAVTLKKNKKKYTQIHAPTPNTKMSSKIVSSNFETLISTELPWLEYLSGTEEIIVYANDATLMKTKTSFELDAIAPDQEIDILKYSQISIPDDLLSFQDLSQKKQKTQYKPKITAENIANKPLNFVLSEFSLSLESDDPAQKRKGLDLMIQYLNSNSKAAAQLTQAILTNELASKFHAQAFLALELSGNNEAQQALIDVMQNTNHTNINRMRSMIALQDVANPAVDVVTALSEELSMLNRTDSNHDIATTAALSLGALAGKNQESYPEYADQATTALKTALNSESNPESTTVLLLAMGNTRNPELSNNIISYLSDESGQTRASAAAALGSIQTPENEIILQSTLAFEKDQNVRFSIIKALNKYKEPSQETISQIASKIRTEPDHVTRAEMIKLLGKKAEANPMAKQTLISLEQTETNNHNISLIGKYIHP